MTFAFDIISLGLRILFSNFSVFEYSNTADAQLFGEDNSNIQEFEYYSNSIV